MLLIKDIPKASTIYDAPELSVTEALSDPVAEKLRKAGISFFVLMVISALASGFLGFDSVLPYLTCLGFIIYGITSLIAASRINRLSGGSTRLLMGISLIKPVGALAVGAFILLIVLVSDALPDEGLRGRSADLMGHALIAFIMLLSQPWILPAFIVFIIAVIRIFRYIARRMRCTEELTASRSGAVGGMVPGKTACNYSYEYGGSGYLINELSCSEDSITIKVDPSAPEYFYSAPVFGKKLRGWLITAAVSFLVIASTVGYDIWVFSHDVVMNNGSGFTYYNESDTRG